MGLDWCIRIKCGFDFLQSVVELRTALDDLGTLSNNIHQGCLKSAHAPSEANASGRVDPQRSQILNPNPSLLGEGFMPPLSPSTAPALSAVVGVATGAGREDLYKTNEKSQFSPSGPPRDHHASHASHEPPRPLPRDPDTASRGHSSESPRLPAH